MKKNESVWYSAGGVLAVFLIIVLVNFAGYTVVEAAPMVGLSRSYAQRRLGAARAAIISYVIAA